MTASVISRPLTAMRGMPRTRAVALTAAAVSGVTLLVRLALHTGSFDLFGDEVLYVDLGRSVISGGLPNFGGPFFLHGPGFFYLEAGWARIAGQPATVMGWVYEGRTLNALFAAATAAVLVLLATRASSLRIGVVVGLLFALDPFCIRQNDRVLLETSMMFWVVLGYLVFNSMIGRPPSRRDWLRALGAGLLFGCAVLTKDEGSLLTLVPLLVAFVLGWGPPRRSLTLLAVTTTVAVYGVYVLVVAANHQFAGLWYAKTLGIKRMLGLVQTTGFHGQSSGSSGSLSSRLVAEMGYFGTTYILLALAALMWVVLMVRGDQFQRMLGLLYSSAGVTLAYAVLLGTLEEQELYLLIVPGLLIIPVAATLLSRRRQRSSGSAASGRHEAPADRSRGTTAVRPREATAYWPDETTGYGYRPHETNAYRPDETTVDGYRPYQTTGYGYRPYQTTGYGYGPHETTGHRPDETTAYRSREATPYRPDETTVYRSGETTAYRPNETSAYRRQKASRPAAIFGALALALVLGINTVTCAQWLRHPDDGWAQLFPYLASHLPNGTKVGVTNDDISGIYGLADSYQVYVVGTSADLSQYQIRYVVVEWSQINEGYSYLSPSDVRKLVAHSQKVFSVTGRTYGDLALYRVAA